MRGFKRKQIVVLSLVLMIVVAGYLQYSYKKTSVSIAGQEENGRTGESVYVDNTEVSIDELVNSDVENTEGFDSITASQHANSFFAQAKLDKEISLSRDRDMLKQITEDENANDEIKAEAFDKMMKIVDNSQRESKIENLVREIGFEDVIVFFANDDSLDIVVKTPGLTSAETAQISDVVLRHAGIDMDKLTVKNIY